MSNVKAEFFSDERKQSYLGGLVTERAGYELKLAGATASEDEAAAKRYQQRIDQVDAELKRLGTDATTEAKRAARR